MEDIFKMSTKGKRPMRALTAGDKIEAIQRVNDGESKASVARDIGVPESTLRGWCKNEDKLRYMSSRHSTPDTDKSMDGMSDPVPEKRARYDIDVSPLPVSLALANAHEQGADLSMRSGTPSEIGLDLSSGDKVKTADLPPLAKEVKIPDATMSPIPVELCKAKVDLSRFNTELVNNTLLHNDNKMKSDLAASVSMSAISPLTGLGNLSGMTGLSQSHYQGLSYNEIATNLSLIAQLNPSLTALTNSINSSAKTLRSIRSPKPNPTNMNITAGLNLTDKYKSSHKSHHGDSYSDRSRSKSSYISSKEQPVDDALWYWLKTQQAMLDLSAHSAQLPQSMAQSLPHSRSPKENRNHSPKPLTPMSPISAQLDTLNQNSWFWQYYKQFGGIPLMDDKTKMTAQVPKEKNDNILYSHLTKGKTHEPIPLTTEFKEIHRKEALSPETMNNVVSTTETTSADKVKPDTNKNHSKARNVLDNLLFNNNDLTSVNNEKPVEIEKDNAENEYDGDVSEALDHGEKFLKWLEACADPSVTRMQVYQLKGLLTNIRTRAERKPQVAQDRVSRRK